MKRILAPTLLLILLFPTLAFGETYSDLVKRDGLYYKKFSTVPFTGKVTGMVRGTFKNGKKIGPWFFFWKNGQLALKETYKDGKGTGVWVLYRTNGRVAKKGNYKDEEPDRDWIRFYEKGESREFGKLLEDLTERKKSGSSRWLVENKIVKIVRNQVLPCWHIPANAKDAQKMKVSIRVKLNRDGTLIAGFPQVVDETRFKTDRLFRVVVESAIRAVHRCSPLKLPAKHYRSWKDITFNFDPSEALGP